MCFNSAFRSTIVEYSHIKLITLIRICQFFTLRRFYHKYSIKKCTKLVIFHMLICIFTQKDICPYPYISLYKCSLCSLNMNMTWMFNEHFKYKCSLCALNMNVTWIFNDHLKLILVVTYLVLSLM